MADASGQWSYRHVRAADLLSQYLPRPFAYWLGLRVADVRFRNDARGRRAVMSNLRHILQHRGVNPSEETVEKMARRTFGYFGKYCVDFFRLSRLSRERVNRLVSFEHMEYVEQAAKRGKGALLVTAHFGNWELGGAVLAAMGYPLHAVVLPHPNGHIEALFQQRRESRGLRVIPLGAAARHTLRALRQREFVCVLADRDYTPHAERVPFFGVPARFPMGPVRLAVATGSPLVAGFALRQEDGTHLLRFHPPLVPAGPDSAHDLQTRLCGILEREVEANPCQWFMFDDFWANGESGGVRA